MCNEYKLQLKKCYIFKDKRFRGNNIINYANNVIENDLQNEIVGLVIQKYLNNQMHYEHDVDKYTGALWVSRIA